MYYMWKPIVENRLIKVAVNIQHSFNQWSKSRFIWKKNLSQISKIIWNLNIDVWDGKEQTNFSSGRDRGMFGSRKFVSSFWSITFISKVFSKSETKKKFPKKTSVARCIGTLLWMTNYTILCLNCVKMIVKNPFYC